MSGEGVVGGAPADGTDRQARWRRAVGLVALLVAVLVLAAAPVGAAGDAVLTATVADSSIGVGESTSVALLMDPASGGVGAYNLTVTVDPGVATVENATVAGDPGYADVSVAEDGGSADLLAAFADTADEGRVTVGTVTLVGDAAGEAGVDLTVTELADETGESYELTNVTGATVEVDATGDETGDSSPSAGSEPGSTEDATPTEGEPSPGEGWRPSVGTLGAGLVLLLGGGAAVGLLGLRGVESGRETVSGLVQGGLGLAGVGSTDPDGSSAATDAAVHNVGESRLTCRVRCRTREEVRYTKEYALESGARTDLPPVPADEAFELAVSVVDGPTDGATVGPDEGPMVAVRVASDRVEVVVED